MPTTILCVDDDADNRLSLSLLLEGERYHVLEAARKAGTLLLINWPSAWGREWQELERGIDFEGRWLVAPVQKVCVISDTPIRVFSSVVISPGGLSVQVGHS